MRIPLVLRPTLDVLDEGLRLYRRAFGPFVVLTALGSVPFIGVIALLIYSSLAATFPFVGLVILALGLLSFPIAIYAIGAISRVTIAVAAGAPPNIATALRIRPLRVVGMGCYGGVFLTVVNTLVSMLSLIFACPIYFAMIFATFLPLGLIGSNNAFGEALTGIALSVISIGTLLIYGGSFMVSGASFCSLIFSLQPFSQEQLRFGTSIQRSLDISTYRLGQNILAWLCASLVFGAIVVAVTVAIGAIVPLPLLLALGQESLITQGVSAAAWVIGLTLALPPLPIWMALLYQQRMRERDGGDLHERLAALETSLVVPQSTAL